MWNRLLDIIFPTRCVSCGREGEIICPACPSSIERPLNEVPGVQALFSYKDPRAARAVWKLKYTGLTSAGEGLGMLLGELVLADLGEEMRFETKGLLVVAVPLSRERLRQRGYNQALLLARGVARATGIPLAENALEKIRHTKTQVSLKDRAERLDNLAGAFTVIEHEKIRGMDIIAIDDVHTTGTTLREISRVLEEAGARSVRSYTLAH